ncbi:asparaginase [Fusarium subglutinans]|uniref:Asparaginase n=1 Tax=Gibberella subglutinans TaxID=42677 RepID=A0A8H5L2H8_GIBSU|nr:asparaginase [Fusarium subglutinans]KAF5583353.1 asparaginase [Fusarium subglutinans]
MTQTKYVENNCVITDRNGIVENIHRVHVAVTDSHGNILYAVGNPARVTLARSAAKPAQALAIIETGGFQDAGFDEIDLALMCASHNAEKRHVERARSMLIKIKAHESDYRCGGHASLNPAVNQDWAQKGLDVTGGIYNNCSGKHAGIIAGALALGASITDYHSPDHPMQVQVKKVVQELCPEPSLVQWATDGCNIPAPAFPLFYLAHTFAVFAAGADSAEQEASPSPRTRNLSRIFRAMSSYPEFVTGEGRFCTDLMQVYKGQLFGKVGADGCYGVGIRESEQTLSVGARGSLGISVKVDDGNLDILYAVVVEVLEQLKIGTSDTRQALESWHHFERKNTMDVVVGSVSFDFKLRSTA